MTTKLTYNQFRSAHKGTPRKEISNLWNLYKEGEYTFPPEEETQPQEPITETPVETVASIEKVPEKSASMDELCKEFDHLRTKMSKFTFRFSKEAKEAGRKRMMEIAKLTIPKNYTCSPTDSWKIWFGPTSICLLINTTNMMGFRVTREWWQKNYQTTLYVDRELLPNNDLMVTEANKLARSGQYVPRTPLVGIECKLPQGVKDIQMRGGQAGDY
jgi:hypothetical protein